MARAVRKPLRWVVLAPAGAGALCGLALVLMGLGEGAGFQTNAAASAGRPRVVNVHVPEQDRKAITDWPSFFACYGLLQSTNVMVATLREGGYPTRPFAPERPVRVVLRPPRQDAILDPEREVLDAAKALADRPAATSVCRR